MVVALVDKGIWTPAQALAFAHPLSEPEQARTLIELANFAPHFRHEILSIAGTFGLTPKALILMGLAGTADEGRSDFIEEVLVTALAEIPH